MTLPQITVAIPTCNRAELLRCTLGGILAQQGVDLSVLVLDNASTDHTAAVVASFRDARITYHRNPVNIGMVPNFNRAIALNRSPYLNVFFDDDIMLPGFLRESVALLEQHPNAGFSIACAQCVDADGAPLHPADPDLVALDLPTGIIPGLDYLHYSTGGRRGGNPSTVVFRASALARAGGFDSPHSKHTTELNLYLRLARHFDVAFLRKELVRIRLHPQQASNLEWSTERLGYVAEYIDAVAGLLQSERVEDPAYRAWLADRLMALNARQSEALWSRVPNLYWSWQERLEMAVRELAESVPAGAVFILADEDYFGAAADLPDRRRLPFLERGGMYWGGPPDAPTAIRELERMRAEGATFLAIAWPAFWLLDRHPHFTAHLRARYRRVLETSRLAVFGLAGRELP